MILIFIFRHLADRARFHSKMISEYGIEPKPFSLAVREGQSRLPANSSQLFPRKQLLFLLYTDFVGNPTKTIEQMSHFLGVPAPRTEHKPFEKESMGQSKQAVLDATDAEYLLSLHDEDLKLLHKLVSFKTTSWFH